MRRLLLVWMIQLSCIAPLCAETVSGEPEAFSKMARSLAKLPESAEPAKK